MVESTAIILAGGVSSRMNYNNKAFLRYKGKSFIEIALDHAKDFKEILIVAKTVDQYKHEGVKTVADLYPERGPLCGIYSGLIEAKYDISVVFSVDTPFLEPNLMVRLANLCKKYDAVVPRKGKYFQPLCAAYSKRCLPVIKDLMDQGRNKPIDIYDLINIYYMTEEEVNVYGDFDKIFRNINTLDEYENMIIQEVE